MICEEKNASNAHENNESVQACRLVLRKLFEMSVCTVLVTTVAVVVVTVVAAVMVLRVVVVAATAMQWQR